MRFTLSVDPPVVIVLLRSCSYGAASIRRLIEDTGATPHRGQSEVFITQRLPPKCPPVARTDCSSGVSTEIVKTFYGARSLLSARHPSRLFRVAYTHILSLSHTRASSAQEGLVIGIKARITIPRYFATGDRTELFGPVDRRINTRATQKAYSRRGRSCERNS